VSPRFATSRSESETGWSGLGVGVVGVEAPTVDVLIFTESGIWQPEHGRETRFSNVYRWSMIDPQRVRLEHLRFGVERPVYLFDLGPASNDIWLPASPHLCREDCYSAKLRLHDTGVDMSWSINGPKKQECIDYEYRWQE
jgi:hypothetical protein